MTDGGGFLRDMEILEPTTDHSATRQCCLSWRRFWLGIAVSLLFLWLVIRQVDWHFVVNAVQEVSLLWLLVGSGTGIVVYGLFALRWQGLLISTAKVSTLDALSYIMIGYLVNTIMPLRLGDVVRVALLGRKRSVSAVSVFGIVLVERFLDVGWVLLIALLFSFFAPLPEVVKTGALVFAVVTLFGLGALVLLIRIPPAHLEFWLCRLPFIPTLWRERGLVLVASFVSGLQVLGRIGQLWRSVWISGLAWLIVGLGTMSYVHAFKLPVPWYAGWAILIVVNLGAIIPSSPGFVGVYHYLVWVALSLWLADKNTAIGYAIVTHGLNILVILVLGTISLWHEGWSLQDITRVKADVSR